MLTRQKRRLKYETIGKTGEDKMKMPCISLTYFTGEKRINRMWENNIAKNFSKVIKNLNLQIKKT